MFNDLANKGFRRAFLEENIKTGIAFQVRALREKNKWSQPKLGERAGKTQSVISRIEDPNYGNFTIRTLLDLAAAFDVALLVKFVSYSQLLFELKDLSPKALAVSSYEEETEVVEQAVTTAAASSAASPSPHANDRGRGLAIAAAKPPATQAPSAELLRTRTRSIRLQMGEQRAEVRP